MNINKVMIYGNIVRDFELKQTQSGVNLTEISVATNFTRYDQNKNKVETVEYHSIVLFGRNAELACQYLGKGKGVFIEGRLQTQTWDDKNTGEKRYKTVIVCERMQFGPNKVGASETQQVQPVQQTQASLPPQQQAQEQKNTQQEYEGEGVVANKDGTYSQAGSKDKIDYPAETIDPNLIPF